jgi:hypothetical protein
MQADMIIRVAAKRRGSPTNAENRAIMVNNVNKNVSRIIRTIPPSPDAGTPDSEVFPGIRNTTLHRR